MPYLIENTSFPFQNCSSIFKYKVELKLFFLNELTFFKYIKFQRVKASITPKLLQSEPKLKEEHYKSQYTIEYPTKQGNGDPSGYVPRPIPGQNVDYLRSVQEKVIKLLQKKLFLKSLNNYF